MTRFVCGEDRTQVTLFPEVLDDYITEENPVSLLFTNLLNGAWNVSQGRRPRSYQTTIRRSTAS